MFKQAKPVFVAGYRDELNLFFGFYTRIPQGKETLLRITGSSLYSIFVNGEFVFSQQIGELRVKSLFSKRL